MKKQTWKRISAGLCSAVLLGAAMTLPHPLTQTQASALTAAAADKITIADMPQDYVYAADWIWNNRIMKEDSLGINSKRWNNLFDQIVAGQGTLNYVVRWQSYKTVNYEQRKQFEQLVDSSINGWTKWLSGFENWPYDHVQVNIVGWAVIDKSCLLDLHSDEVVYTDTEYYDAQYDTSNGFETIPDKLPNAPSALSRFDHFGDRNYVYPGGLDKRFDMYLWATEGFPSIGGCGGDWGQRLSDTAYLNMLDGSGLHVHEHELGHGFGMTDFYGGEGASDGFPPGGFPGGENSLMMAGSAAKITDFDGWMLRYMWSKLKDDTTRFDLSNVPDVPDIPDMPDIPVTRIMGDVNADGQFNMADVMLMAKWLLALPDGTLADWQAGDFNGDQKLDAVDFTWMKRALMQPTEITPPASAEFLPAPIRDVKGFLPSQGDANLVIFYIDFPDCKYDYAPAESEIYEIAFGAEDTGNQNYPFDSMRAFYSRSSKGAMNLKGNVFRYTTKNNQAYYNENKFLITQECYEAFKDTTDFAQYDGDGDGYIDCTLLTVPTGAGDDHWWPCAGPVDQDNYYVDGKRVGHIITGNAQIASRNDYYNFNSTYLHEMGHCMGLPDYYLFNSNDSEGMHGTGGCELMDTDATTDFGAVSKLQLGWYTDAQLNIFDGSQSSVTYTLYNAQGSNSNCVVIPYGDLNNFHSEYMIVEYTTKTGNNSHPAWWVNPGDGVRVYHAETTLYDHGWWVGYKYGSGSEFTNKDQGRRFLRIIDDEEKDNLYHDGDVIDNRILGFNWYDGNGNQTIDTGLTITVSEMNGDTCKVTITKK